MPSCGLPHLVLREDETGARPERGPMRECNGELVPSVSAAREI
jgi:hypothetical protein